LIIYFNGVKNKRVVAIGYDPKNVIPECKILNYTKITKPTYNALNKTFLNNAKQTTAVKHKNVAR
jgi:hypothetical protein